MFNYMYNYIYINILTYIGAPEPTATQQIFVDMANAVQKMRMRSPGHHGEISVQNGDSAVKQLYVIQHDQFIIKHNDSILQRYDAIELIKYNICV